VDHCIEGSAGGEFRSGRTDSADGHGVGLSIGTDAPLDLTYLDKVAAVTERLGAPIYGDPLAFTTKTSITMNFSGKVCT